MKICNNTCNFSICDRNWQCTGRCEDNIKLCNINDENDYDEFQRISGLL